MQAADFNKNELDYPNILILSEAPNIVTQREKKILVMGVGNTLMQDDGVGSRITEALLESKQTFPGLEIVDGGTIGLALLPQIENADALIMVDASEMNESPGTLRLFRNEEIDAQLSGKRRTVHEVALVDLLSAAAIRGRMPAERVLLAIQPGCTEWGVDLTPEVIAAIPLACQAINELAVEWAGTEVAA
jgi:hydrogenase maturation protease